MKQAIQSPSASSRLTKDSEKAFKIYDESTETISDDADFELFIFDQFTAPLASAPEKHTDIDDLVDKWEIDDKRRVALEEARSWIADTFHSQDGDTVRTMRLRKGWSQSQLASELGTSQPHIYRIERGTENLAIDTCRRLCKALEIDMNTLEQALSHQEKINNSKVSPK